MLFRSGLDPDTRLDQARHQGSVGADRDHLVASRRLGPGKRQQEVIEGEIDGAELADFHGLAATPSPSIHMANHSSSMSSAQMRS